MMISTKPMSSPGRTEKLFPPPLTRFLRSNVGGRSFKGGNKSRSSPLFILRKRNANGNAVDNTHEPSSPKVTCIGQVRPHKQTHIRPEKKTHIRCLWPKNCHAPACLCPHLLKQIKPRSFCSGFGKWVMSCRVGWCGKVRAQTEEKRMEDRSVEKEVEGRLEAYEGLDDSSVAVQPPRNAFVLTRCRSSSYRGNETEDQSAEKEEVEGDGFDSSATVQPPPMNAFLLTRCKSSSYRGNGIEEIEVRLGSSEGLDPSATSQPPPKNAFLLTRCRSAPYRSSSLATRLLGNEAEKVEEEREAEDGNGREEAGEDTSEVEPDDRDSVSESRTGEETETTADGRAEEITAVEVAETAAELMLTRCKSEPATAGERLTAVARFCGDREGSALTGPASAPRVSD